MDRRRPQYHRDEAGSSGTPASLTPDGTPVSSPARTPDSIPIQHDSEAISVKEEDYELNKNEEMESDWVVSPRSPAEYPPRLDRAPVSPSAHCDMYACSECSSCPQSPCQKGDSREHLIAEGETESPLNTLVRIFPSCPIGILHLALMNSEGNVSLAIERILYQASHYSSATSAVLQSRSSSPTAVSRLSDSKSNELSPYYSIVSPVIRFCSHCGSRVFVTDNFCYSCGVKLKKY